MAVSQSVQILPMFLLPLFERECALIDAYVGIGGQCCQL
jgi:hypothetical protein